MQGVVNPANPLGLTPIRITNIPQPIRYRGEEGPLLSFTISASYQFLDQRSRVGDISLDTESAAIDFAGSINRRPFTSFNISYTYSYVNGSSPVGTGQTIDQHVGSVRLLQPIQPIFVSKDEWQPAALSSCRLNHQFAIILGADYGGSVNSTEIPHVPVFHGSTGTFVGNALLDYQFAWFPNRPLDDNATPPDLAQDNYATLFIELTSGVQFSTTHLDLSNRNSAIGTAGRQLTYQNIASLNYSFWRRFGLLVAAEWDAPLDSVPLRGSEPYYANTAVFTAGLTYNYSPGARYSSAGHDSGNIFKRYVSDPNRWSLGLFYSYIAFDPFTETNQLQFQISFSF